MNANIANGGHQLPLFTIEEGGSSVSSGTTSLTSMINGVSHTKCFLNGLPSENTLTNGQLMQNPFHQYLQTCTSNNSRGKDNIVFEIPPFNQTSQTPLPGLAGINMVYGGTKSSGTHSLFDSAERRN